MANQFATRLSLLSFVSRLADGLICRDDFYPSLLSALVTAGIFFVVGYACGELARRLVQELAANEVKDLIEQQSASSTN
ncbi:MAG: hypothetical protein ACKVT0_11695 [Planctomycetaceae bacterium]